MATTKLKLYNEALRNLGERPIASLTESTERRRKLDEVWDGEALDTVLQMGQWNFAARSMALEYDPSITPWIGYTHAFEKPSDFIRLMGLCQDEYFRIPLNEYVTDGGYWYADQQTLYVRFVSNDAQYGGDYSLWPPNFTRLAGAWLAHEVCPGLTHDDTRTLEMEKKMKRRLKEAKAVDSMEQPTKFNAPSSWVLSRRGKPARESESGTLLD